MKMVTINDDSITFMRINNSSGATGDGYILAYEAGARLQDKA